MMNYYPVYLNLQQRRAVVIGGGVIAEGKVQHLLEAGAAVTVISPELTKKLRVLAAEGLFHYEPREYQWGDLTGAFLVISATDDRDVNEQVWAEATELNILANVVDDVPHCNFIAPSIVRRGDLTIAVSTSGKAPVLAVRLREKIERDLVREEHARFLEIAGHLRAPLAARYPGFETRKKLWYQLIDSDILDLLRDGDEIQAHQRIHEIMGIEVMNDQR
jgi:precorrin-2 dehydrogenase / sirohydrochlorin ferrochelatase